MRNTLRELLLSAVRLVIDVLTSPSISVVHGMVSLTEAINMNILMIIGIILGGGVSVASTVGITVGIFGTIVYKFYRKLRFGISMFD